MTATFLPAHEARAAGICSWCQRKYHASKQDGGPVVSGTNGIVVPGCARCRRKLRGKEKDDE